MSTDAKGRVFSVLSFFLIATAHAEPVNLLAGLNSFPPDIGAMSEALHKVENGKCKLEACSAVFAILRATMVMGIAEATPMRMAMTGPDRWAYVARITNPVVINKQLDTALLSHPHLFPAICARLQDMSEHYDEVAKPFDSGFVGMLMEVAELIDNKTVSAKKRGSKTQKSTTQGQCLPAMLAPLPHTAEMDKLINSYGGICSSRQWHNPGCRRIARPAASNAAKP